MVLDREEYVEQAYFYRTLRERMQQSMSTQELLGAIRQEILSRNRLGYDYGLEAVARDPAYDEGWREWILTVRRQVGIVDFADMIYVRSEHYRQQRGDPGKPILFGEREGKIALANRRKDPLFLFSALARHLGYPSVPRPKIDESAERLFL